MTHNILKKTSGGKATKEDGEAFNLLVSGEELEFLTEKEDPYRKCYNCVLFLKHLFVCWQYAIPILVL